MGLRRLAVAILVAAALLPIGIGTMRDEHNLNILGMLQEIGMNQDMICRPDWAVQTHADLKRHEGFRPYAYPDPLSKLGKAHGKKFGYKPADEVLRSIGGNEADGRPWTIGYGFAEGIKLTDHVTEEQASEQLWPKIFKYASYLDDLVPNWGHMPLHVQSTLINLVFNMGPAGLAKFKNTLPLFVQGKYEAAGKALTNSLWFRQVGTRAIELTQRLVTGNIPDRFKALT